MPRILLALLVAIGIGVFAAPASAHVHGGGHRAATAESTVIGASAADVAATAMAAMVAAVEGACDRDCDHGPGMADCSCMATCVALALPDLPTIDPVAPAAGPRPADAAPWRPTALVPPTPPPRA